jgi:hypothetical protein
MPFQVSPIDTIDKRRRPSKIIACADIPFESGPASRREPWFSKRIGFVGSAEGFDLLRYEAPTVALTPANALSVVDSRLIDILVVEHAFDDLCDEWGASFIDWSMATEGARALMAEARNAAIPRVALLRGGPGQLPLFMPLARDVDHVIATDTSVHQALTREGIEVRLCAPVMQPASYNAFEPFAGEVQATIGMFSLDLDRAIDNPTIADILTTLIPFEVSLFSPDLVVTAERVATLGPLASRCGGTLTAGQLRRLFKAQDVLIQIARTGRDPGVDVEHALQAVASRCVVAVLGKVSADDPRRGFAQIFDHVSDLRGFLSRLKVDHAWGQRQLQAGWRKVHRDHSAASLVSLIAELLGIPDAKRPRPRATVVTPTFRPELLSRTLATFRSQSWEDKELIVVANTDRPAEWRSDLVNVEAGERIVFLPRQFGPGVALNMGAARSTGDYVMRMDDDDYYGVHYVEDMMLAADAMWPDIMGKSATYYNYVDAGRVVWVPQKHFRPSSYKSDSLRTPRGGHLAGFSHTVRRDVFTRVQYPRSLHAAADTGFLDDAETLGDLLCVRTDGLNAVVERRSDLSSHTWRTARPYNDKQNVDLSMDMSEFLA